MSISQSPILALARSPSSPRHLTARLRRVKLLLCDVDGVLTDGTVWIGRDFEAKGFSILDGMGLALLRRAGLHRSAGFPAVPATAQRAARVQRGLPAPGQDLESAGSRVHPGSGWL